MKEIWKDVKGYEGLYQVSSLGRVKSFRQWARAHKPQEYILKPSLITSGYHVVTLYKNSKREKFQVHRLVANTFIPNPEKLPCVNHKDENKLNNAADNLEWCTYTYNNNYGTARIRAIETKAKPLYQYTLEGHLLAKYTSVGIAAQLLNIPKENIKTWLATTGQGNGYIWKYE